MSKILTAVVGFVSLFVALVALPQTIGSLKRLDERYGFQDAHFGASVSSIKGLHLVTDHGTTKLYQRRPSTLQVGRYNLQNVTYSFYKGQLMALLAEKQHSGGERPWRA